MRLAVAIAYAAPEALGRRRVTSTGNRDETLREQVRTVDTRVLAAERPGG